MFIQNKKCYYIYFFYLRYYNFMVFPYIKKTE